MSSIPTNPLAPSLQILIDNIIKNDYQPWADAHNKTVISDQAGELWAVDVAAVTAIMTAANNLQPSPSGVRIFDAVAFTPVPPAPPPVPNLVIKSMAASFDAMGIFGAEGDINPPSANPIPAGTLHTELSGPLAGQYRKFQWGSNIAGPTYYWQRIG